LAFQGAGGDDLPVLTQIYGLTTVEDAALCADAGVGHLGLVIAEGFHAWDEVDADTGKRILSALDGRARRVLLSLAVDPRTARRVAQEYRPDILHLVRTPVFEPKELEELRARLERIALMCTIAVRGPDALETARRYEEVADFLLLDSADEGTGVVGATGLTHDWSISAQIVASTSAPIILAGGLGPHNVAAAIRAVQPAGVDSETHTSYPEDRRRKDLEKVRAFVELAREQPAV
jgi:phosphoribosylanthranilate isomerase